MWELDYKESWVLKNWSFELWCWRRLLRIPWTARRSSQSILEDISPEYSLEGLILWPSDVKKVTHLNVTHFKRPWCWEWLKAGGKGDVRGWDGWMASLTQWTWIWVSSKSWWWTRKPGVIVVHGVAKSRTQLSDWTELKWNTGLGNPGPPNYSYLAGRCRKAECLPVWGPLLLWGGLRRS